MFSDSLAKKIVEVGEMINEQIIETGVWNGTVDKSRIFYCDESLQFIKYEIDGTSSGSFMLPKGMHAKEFIEKTENVSQLNNLFHFQQCYNML